jgi:hypothetical protein
MDDPKRSPYGFSSAEPDEKAGVEVGGGEKPAADRDAKPKDDPDHGGKDRGDGRRGREEGAPEPRDRHASDAS